MKPEKSKKHKKPAEPRIWTSGRVDGLLPKQTVFVTEYLLSGNATQSAIAAGYSPKTAYRMGYENLRKPQIASVLAQKQIEIAKRQDERLEAMELTEARVTRETARIAFFDPRKLFDAQGNPKAITELDDDTAAAISGLDVLEEYEGTGKERRLVGYIKKYKIADKNAALERAAKILAMFGKDNAQKADPFAVLLLEIASGNNSAFLPVLEDPEHDALPARSAER
jgi:phage terminase small subunit